MKNIIVTGASGNMGSAIVKRFLSEGYRVIGTVMANERSEGVQSNFTRVVVDLLNEQDANMFVSSVIDRYTTIDVAVLTVGGFAMGKLADTGIGDINKQLKLNFDTTYNIAKPVFAQMQKQGHGRIFLAGSKPGLDTQSGVGMTSYCLAKSLVFRLAELMNIEAKGTNVVTSVIVPGTIDTSQNRQSMPDTDFTKWTKPEDIGEVVHFYCSDAAKVIREPVIKLYNNS